MFRETLTRTGNLYPSAYFTILRTALMGSAHAVWLLKPDEHQQRLKNALFIVRDDIEQTKLRRCFATIRRRIRRSRPSSTRRRNGNSLTDWPGSKR